MSFSHKMINNFKRRSIKFPFSTKISLLNHFVLLLLCQNLTKALCKNFAINSTGNVAEQFAFNSEAGRWFLRELCDDAKHINKLSEFMRREHPSLEKVLINLHRNACANLKQNVGKSDDLKESLRSEFFEVLHGTKLPIRKTIDRLKQQIMNSNLQEEAGANVKNVAKHCVLSRLKRGSNNSNEIQRANPMRGINKGITTSGKQFKLKIEKPPWQLIKIQNNHQGKSRGVEKQIEQSKNAKELVPFNGNSVPKCQLADKCEEKLAKWVKNKFVVLENRFHQISSIQTMGIDQIPKSILPAIESLQFLLENDQRIRAFVDAIFGEPESNTSKEIEKHDKMLELERNENLSKTQKQSEILIAADISKTSQNENGVKGIVKNVDSKGKGEIVASREHIRFWDCHRPLEQKQQRQTIPSTNDSQPFWRRIYNELRGNHPASSSTSTQQNGQNRHQTNANNEVWDDNWRYDPENSAYGALLGIQFPYLNYRKKRVIPALTPQKRQKIYACLVALTLIGLLLFVLGFTTKHGTVGHQLMASGAAVIGVSVFAFFVLHTIVRIVFTVPEGVQLEDLESGLFPNESSLHRLSSSDNSSNPFVEAPPPVLTLTQIAARERQANKLISHKTIPVAADEKLEEDCPPHNGEHTTCPICLDEFKPEERLANDDVVRLTNCRHVFHRKCLFEWFFENPESASCPICRHSYSTSVNTSVRIGLTNVESSGDEEAASGENNNLRGRDVDYFYYGPGSLSSSSANRRTESSDDEATPLRRNRPGSLFLCSSSNRRSESSDDATTTPLRRNRSRLSPVVEDDPDPIVNISAFSSRKPLTRALSAKRKAEDTKAIELLADLRKKRRKINAPEFIDSKETESQRETVSGEQSNSANSHNQFQWNNKGKEPLFADIYHNEIGSTSNSMERNVLNERSELSGHENASSANNKGEELLQTYQNIPITSVENAKHNEYLIEAVLRNAQLQRNSVDKQRKSFSSSPFRRSNVSETSDDINALLYSPTVYLTPRESNVSSNLSPARTTPRQSNASIDSSLGTPRRSSNASSGENVGGSPAVSRIRMYYNALFARSNSGDHSGRRRSNVTSDSSPSADRNQKRARKIVSKKGDQRTRAYSSPPLRDRDRSNEMRVNKKQQSSRSSRSPERRFSTDGRRKSIGAEREKKHKELDIGSRSKSPATDRILLKLNENQGQTSTQESIELAERLSSLSPKMRCTSSVRRKSSEPAYNRERTGQLELEHQRETKSSPSSGADADESDYNSTTGGKRRRGRGLYRRLHRGNKKSPPKNDGSSPDEPEQSLLRSHAGCFS